MHRGDFWSCFSIKANKFIGKLFKNKSIVYGLYGTFDYKQWGFTSFSGRTATACCCLAMLNSPVFSHSFDEGLNFRIVFILPISPYPPYFIFLFLIIVILCMIITVMLLKIYRICYCQACISYYFVPVTKIWLLTDTTPIP